ncbi:type II secretion system protein GspM [Brevundimonas sp.]|uniref:type II secretion system protein GspM n=1 Tax=Brevundimonas sp. TaxID=1871086 RepID=UPI002FC8FB21
MMSLQSIWDSRTRREQVMLAGLGLLVAGVVAWYGIIQPVQNWRDSAAFERQAAEARLLRMTRQIEYARAYTGYRNVRSALEQAARQAEVQIQISTQGAGLAFDLDRIPSQSGRAFLINMERARLSPKLLHIQAYDDGSLRISGQTD